MIQDMQGSCRMYWRNWIANRERCKRIEFARDRALQLDAECDGYLECLQALDQIDPAILCSNSRQEQQQQQQQQEDSESSSISEEEPRFIWTKERSTYCSKTPDKSFKKGGEDDDDNDNDNDDMDDNSIANGGKDAVAKAVLPPPPSNFKDPDKEKKKKKKKHFDDDNNNSNDDENLSMTPSCTYGSVGSAMPTATPAFFFFLGENRMKIERNLSRKHHTFNRLPKGLERNEIVAREGALWWIKLRPSEIRRFENMSMHD